MCVQSLSLWAEATRYRLQERHRRNADEPVGSDAGCRADAVSRAEAVRRFDAEDREVLELVGATRSGRSGE